MPTNLALVGSPDPRREQISTPGRLRRFSGATLPWFILLAYLNTLHPTGGTLDSGSPLRNTDHDVETGADQIELFNDFPVIARHALKRSPVRQLLDATEKHGTLLPQSVVVTALGVSKQRVSQLVATGQLASVEAAGKKWVPAAALELFLVEERKNGRPALKAA